MHVTAWMERLAASRGEPRDRLVAALERLAPDAATVLAPLPADEVLVESRVVDAGARELDARWRVEIGSTFRRLDLPLPPPAAEPATVRTGHSDAFRALHAELTSVRRLDPGATW